MIENVRVSILPEREEIVIRSPGFDGVALQHVGATQLQMCKSADGFVEHNAAVVEEFLELQRGVAASMRGQIGSLAHIDSVESGRESTVARCPQLVGNGGLKSFDGL